MALSFPSKLLTLIDIPEVSNFNASFIYNFYVKDEKINDSGSPQIRYPQQNLDFKALSRHTPRMIKFSFSPVTIYSNASGDDAFVMNLSRDKDVKKLIFENMDLIFSDFGSSSRREVNFSLITSSLIRVT